MGGSGAKPVMVNTISRDVSPVHIFQATCCLSPVSLSLEQCPHHAAHKTAWFYCGPTVVIGSCSHSFRIMRHHLPMSTFFKSLFLFTSKYKSWNFKYNSFYNVRKIFVTWHLSPKSCFMKLYFPRLDIYTLLRVSADIS